jgi:RNA polymerase sigma-70 factor (ECF subfamily)
MHETTREAFAELVEPHRRELHVHCYRMLGSLDDADDALQETLLAAWRGFGGFEGRAALRTWLYRVATNTCLNLVRAASRRPQMTDFEGPAPNASFEVTWLQPYPDALLDESPEASVERAETVSLAFVTALQRLSPRARAVLILRDVLDFKAREVARLLDSNEDAVATTLTRARVRVQQKQPAKPTDATLVQRLAAALTAHDIDAVVELLAADVRLAMPPLPPVWEGREQAARFLAEVPFRLVPEVRILETRANRQPALASYARDEANGCWRASGLLVIDTNGDEVTMLTRFESHLFAAFGLPRSLHD